MKKREEEEELKRIENIPWIQLTPLQRQKLVCWMDKEKEKEKAMAAVGIKPSTSSSSSGSKRKRKKRRKKKTPRASSHPSLRRAHCRQRQRYVLAGFAGYDTPCAVLPSIVNARGDSTGAFLGPGDMPVVILSGGFGQTVQKTADSPQLQSIAGRQHPLRAANADPHGPVCSADHGDSTVAAYFGGLCSCCAGSCRFSGAAVEKPLALPQLQLVEKSVVGLFWVMTSGNVPVFSAFWFYTGYMSTSVYGGLVSLVPRSCRQRQLVLLVSTHFALCFLLCSQALMSHIMAGMDQKDFFVAPQLQFVKVVPFPVVSQRPFPMVQPVWPTTRGFAVAVRAGWSMSLVCNRAGFLCSCSSSTWSSSPLSLRSVYPMVQTVVRPGNPQLLYKVVDFPVSWSCRFTSPSLRRGCFLWSRPLVGPSRLRSCSTRWMVNVPVVRSHSSRVQTWKRQLSSHSCARLPAWTLSFTFSPLCNDRCRVVQTSQLL